MVPIKARRVQRMTAMTEPALTLYRPAPGRLHWLQLRDHGEGSAALLRGEVGIRARSVMRGARGDLMPLFENHRADGFHDLGGREFTGLDLVYPIRGDFPSGSDFALRNRVSDRIEALVLDTGLGHWAGASGGRGEMEIRFDVVDGALARQLIAEDLAGTEFAGFTDIRLSPPERYGAA